MASQNLESNKIFAAILLAALVAMISGFVAKKVVHPHDLDEDAVMIEGAPIEMAGGSAAPAMPDPILDLIATADVAKGQKISKACAACHSFDQGGPNKVGPNLYGVVNAQIAAHDGFSYSDALTSKGENWSYDNLNEFLWKPKLFAPGTKMNYLGLKKPDDRAAVIAWLRTLASSPAALPSEAQIAAEKARLAPPEEEAEEGVEDMPEAGEEMGEAVEENTNEDGVPEDDAPAPSDEQEENDASQDDVH